MNDRMRIGTPHLRYNRNRREFLTETFCGFGSLAFASMMARDTARAAGGRMNPLAPKPPHMPDPKAKAVIFLFMCGGPSHVDTWDPKPLLNELHGQKRPADFGSVEYQNVNEKSRIMGSKRTFKRCGKSGTWVADIFPHQAEIVDDICLINSMYGDMVVHSAAQYQMMTGRVIPGFPAMGSWIVYGLGSEAENLPAYVVMPDPHGTPESGVPMYTHGFLPAIYQPTMLRPGDKPVLNLELPKGLTLEKRRKSLDLLNALNEANLGEDDEFAARMSAYDTAFKMQTEAPEIFDLSNEPQETLEMYGVGQEPTDDYGRRCLLARRLVENGTRFVCVTSGGGSGQASEWDGHSDIDVNHERMASWTDKPVAALIKDLKRRGLLDSTIVLWGGEFGRSPESEGKNGRDHHNYGFSMYAAGGGFKPGLTYGATDAIGLKAVENPVHFRDLHSTILHQLGLNQDQLSYLHLGRKERLTEVHGKILTDLLV